ncbi:MAG: ATP-binding protein [Candidatus Omnitrophota bacterium]|nr:ATP-binding protein [Candidatus Omnitrophota bacterium]
MKIADKIAVSFFLTGLILTGIGVSVAYIVVSHALKNESFNHLCTTVQSRTHHLETFLETGRDQIRQLAESIVIERLLSASAEGEDYSRKLNDATQRLKGTAARREYSYDVFVLNKNGVIVASSVEEDIGKDKSGDPYFLGGEEGVFIKDACVSQDKKIPAIAFSAPVLDEENKVLLGVVVARVPMEKISRITGDRTGLGETGEIYLVNKNGYMITPSLFMKDTFLDLKVDNENTRRAFEDIKKYGDKPHPHKPLLYADYRGVKVWGVHDHVPRMQWIVLAEIDEGEVMGPLSIIRSLFTMMLIFIPLIAGVIGVYLSKRISGPLYKLHKGVEIIGRGNLEYRVGTDAEDEIGQFSREFDRMTESLQKITVSKDYVDNIIGSMTDILIVIDPDAVISMVNKAACELLGYKEDELIGKNISLLFPEEEEEMLFKGTKLEKLIKEEQFENYEINYKAKDGREIPVLLSGAALKAIDCPHKGPVADCPIFKQKGKHCEKILGIVCVARDITERNKMQKLLIESEKLASIGTLVSEMAHEVNNPLMIIAGRSHLSLMEDLKNKELKENLEIIKTQCFRAKDIIHRLLMFSKPSKGGPEENNIRDVLDDAIELLEHQYSLKDIEIARDYAAELPVVKMDRNHIEEVFVNILNNAAEAMPDGGRVTVSAFRKDDKIRVDIKDTGCGIPEGILKNIFDPFFSTKEKGTGLGLSVCYGIVKAHGGKLTYISTPGEGTTATVVLPVEG